MTNLSFQWCPGSGEEIGLAGMMEQRDSRESLGRKRYSLAFVWLSLEMIPLVGEEDISCTGKAESLVQVQIWLLTSDSSEAKAIWCRSPKTAPHGTVPERGAGRRKLKLEVFPGKLCSANPSSQFCAAHRASRAIRAGTQNILSF